MIPTFGALLEIVGNWPAHIMDTLHVLQIEKKRRYATSYNNRSYPMEIALNHNVPNEPINLSYEIFKNKSFAYVYIEH